MKPSPGCAWRLSLALVSLAVAGGVAAAPELTVFAAASLKESMDDAAAAFQRETSEPVRVSYAASSALARQIERGAPADVFVSADTDWMDHLASRGLIDALSRRNLLGNRLVLVASRAGGGSDSSGVGSAPSFEPVRGVALPSVLAHGRIALARTTAVPAGRYARSALTSLGWWPALAPRLIETENVRAALMLVARGEVPFGIVYATDARAEPAVRVLAEFPAMSHPPIVYPAARVAASDHEGAAVFVRWLGSDAAMAIFRQRGFTAAGEGSAR